MWYHGDVDPPDTADRFEIGQVLALKGNIPRISSYTWRFAINTGWFVVLRSNP